MDNRLDRTIGSRLPHRNEQRELEHWLPAGIDHAERRITFQATCRKGSQRRP